MSVSDVWINYIFSHTIQKWSIYFPPRDKPPSVLFAFKIKCLHVLFSPFCLKLFFNSIWYFVFYFCSTSSVKIRSRWVELSKIWCFSVSWVFFWPETPATPRKQPAIEANLITDHVKARKVNLICAHVSAWVQWERCWHPQSSNSAGNRKKKSNSSSLFFTFVLLHFVHPSVLIKSWSTTNKVLCSQLDYRSVFFLHEARSSLFEVNKLDNISPY